MTEYRKRAELNLSSNGHFWIAHCQLRAKQDFVPGYKVEEFMKKYMAGEDIPAPIVYHDGRNGCWVLDDGHKRCIALYKLYQQGITQVGQDEWIQSIVGGLIVKKVWLSPFTHPPRIVFPIEKIKIE